MGRRLTKIRLQYIHEFTDRHGKVRRYVRLPGRKRVPLQGAPGTGEFMRAYEAALAGEVPRIEIGARRTIPGTVNAAVISYFNSSAFASLALESRRTRRGILERFRAEHGDKRVSLLQKAHIDRMIAAKVSMPATARNFLAAINVLMEHCVERARPYTLPYRFGGGFGGGGGSLASAGGGGGYSGGGGGARSAGEYGPGGGGGSFDAGIGSTRNPIAAIVRHVGSVLDLRYRRNALRFSAQRCCRPSTRQEPAILF
jgi:hypothetical protein